MDGKSRDGTWEALAGPLGAQYFTWEGRGEEPSYTETKVEGSWQGVGWCCSTDEALEREWREEHLLKGKLLKK